jgi:hypothetical protein
MVGVLPSADVATALAELFDVGVKLKQTTFA